MTIGEVAQLWRYPVKSLGGERLDDVEIGPRGVLGDRLWAVRDLERDVRLTPLPPVEDTILQKLSPEERAHMSMASFRADRLSR